MAINSSSLSHFIVVPDIIILQNLCCCHLICCHLISNARKIIFLINYSEERKWSRLRRRLLCIYMCRNRETRRRLRLKWLLLLYTSAIIHMAVKCVIFLKKIWMQWCVAALQLYQKKKGRWLKWSSSQSEFLVAFFWNKK